MFFYYFWRNIFKLVKKARDWRLVARARRLAEYFPLRRERTRRQTRDQNPTMGMDWNFDVNTFKLGWQKDLDKEIWNILNNRFLFFTFKSWTNYHTVIFYVGSFVPIWFDLSKKTKTNFCLISIAFDIVTSVVIYNVSLQPSVDRPVKRLFR